MPQLLDPNFKRAVVLLVHHDDDGTFGVVLNRGTEILAKSLCDSIEIEWRGNPETEVHWGGPVQPETGWVLFADEGPELPEDVRQVTPGVSFAGSLEALRVIAGAPPMRFRVILGYAGWGPGQLEAELAAGAWLVAPVERSVVFDVAEDALWVHVVRSLGIEPATLVPARGVH